VALSNTGRLEGDTGSGSDPGYLTTPDPGSWMTNSRSNDNKSGGGVDLFSYLFL
jgi:hypothetical protein